MPKDRRPLFILPLAAFIAISPLLLRGCSCGHDFDFHLINWFEAARQITHGTLLPRWAATPAWNAGEPRFVFYPPLSWLIGALLGLLMPWTWTPIAYTWLALTAAGFSLYYVARNCVPPNAALIAAAVYLANPYTLYTAYERSAYAELFAAAWLPLALHAVLKRRVTIPAVALPVALLWLTNAPAAVMGCYAMAAIVLIRLVLPKLHPLGSASTSREKLSRSIGLQSSPIQLALHSLFGVLLGLGLSSFYLLPAAYERRFVQIGFAILPGLRPWDNFLFEHTSDPEHDAVLHTASIVAVALLALSAIVFLALLFLRNRSKTQSLTEARPHHETLTLLLLAIFIAGMLTPLSVPLWRYLPELRFLQFPWRLLAVLAAVFGVSLSFALASLRIRFAVPISFLCVAILVVPSYRKFHQYCYPEDTVPERLAIFQSSNPGTDPTDEYTPTGADNSALNQLNPGYWLADSATRTAPNPSKPGPAPHQLTLSPSAPTVLILNLRDYPAWHITRNGILVTSRLHRQDGLIAVPLPAGLAHIRVQYAVLTDQRLGYLITAISIFLLCALFVRKPTPDPAKPFSR